MPNANPSENKAFETDPVLYVRDPLSSPDHVGAIRRVPGMAALRQPLLQTVPNYACDVWSIVWFVCVLYSVQGAR